MSHLDIWTVYDHPSDFPDCFVARKARITPATVSDAQAHTNHIVSADTLEEVRQKIQNESKYELSCLTRHPDDDPVIVECWI